MIGARPRFALPSATRFSLLSSMTPLLVVCVLACAAVLSAAGAPDPLTLWGVQDERNVTLFQRINYTTGTPRPPRPPASPARLTPARLDHDGAQIARGG